MKITKSQLKQIIKEELESILSETEAMKDKAIRTAWDLYEKDRGTKPEDSHPDGEKREERACKRRVKARLLNRKARDC
jgi:hypothetical protein